MYHLNEVSGTGRAEVMPTAMRFRQAVKIGATVLTAAASPPTIIENRYHSMDTAARSGINQLHAFGFTLS